jgi:ubiquinone/menaquinone biosynthesis C-methylase UbiE
MQSETMKSHFSRLARSYDELRLTPDLVTPLIETLVAVGDLRGRRVLDIGCGTGRVLTALTLHHAIKGWSIDSSPEMIAVARAQVPESVSVRVAAAEDLPFPDCFFERAYMTFVAHHLDRRRHSLRSGGYWSPVVD